MFMETKRIFITDLPEELSKSDVTTKFSKYGNVLCVEIKERKELGPKNSSKLFAFINIEIEPGNLQKCFEDISNKKWKGQFVNLQLARENFLDRLKKEREEAQNTVNKLDAVTSKISDNSIPTNFKVESQVRANKITYKSSSDSSESDEDVQNKPERRIEAEETVIISQVNGEKVPDSILEVKSDIVFKRNQSKIVNNKLVIESVGNKPIFESTFIKPKSLDPKRSEADQKRFQSLLEKRQGFNRQKLVIKSALAKIDNPINNEGHTTKSTEYNTKYQDKSAKKPKLFDNENEDYEEYNFNVRKQYEGAEGQKLLALQSNYKNDERFAIDERFIENEDEEEEEMNDVLEEDIADEKRKEYQIMEEILGTKITPHSERQKNKLMLRFDPNQPEHSKYEIKERTIEEKTSKKRKQKLEEVKLPEVSKETFFDVADNLKDALQGNSSFSLLGMFGKPAKTRDINQSDNSDKSSEKIKNNGIFHENNPFKYDSSDEDETEATVETIKTKKTKDKTNSATISLGAKKLWTETFFFKEDDYRFQDGMEFVKKLGTEETGGISEVRQEIKQIVRAKVRNNKGKDQMFKRKLGGQKKFKFRRGAKRN